VCFFFLFSENNIELKEKIKELNGKIIKHNECDSKEVSVQKTMKNRPGSKFFEKKKTLEKSNKPDIKKELQIL
jgi:hypothetical protein